MHDNNNIIERIREFNRFYTVLIGSLNRNFLGTEFTVTETRILFELFSNKECIATDLVSSLQIDKSYLSRIIKSFEKKGMLCKTQSPHNRRAYTLTLTEKGLNITKEMIAITHKQIGDLITPLNDNECTEVIIAMDTITNYLSRTEKE